jgi:hypothetical protein
MLVITRTVRAAAGLLLAILCAAAPARAQVRGGPTFDAGQAQRAPAQVVPAAKPGREVYISWGYHGDRYQREDIRFSQPSLGNNFTFHDVIFHDNKGWTDGLFAHQLTIPQYAIQAGLFFKKNTAFEISFIHAKAIVTQDQTVAMSGTINGASVSQNIVLTPDVLLYQLNNGANFALFNIVQRFRIFKEPGQTAALSVLLKAGVGFVVPHTQNTVFGHPNDPGFQFSGPDVGAAIAVRFHIFRAFYTEFLEQGVIARYRDVNIYNGSAEQNLWAHVTALSFGMAWHIGKG